MVRMSSRGLYTSGLLIGILSCFFAVANIWEVAPFFDPSTLLSVTESSSLMSFSLQVHSSQDCFRIRSATLPLLKNWTFPTAKSADEGKGGKNSTTDGDGFETKLFEDHIEDKDEDGSHASAGSL